MASSKVKLSYFGLKQTKAFCTTDQNSLSCLIQVAGKIFSAIYYKAVSIIVHNAPPYPPPPKKKKKKKIA